VFHQACAPRFQLELKLGASNTTMPIINKSRFSRLTLLAPSVEAQRALSTRVDALLNFTHRAVAALSPTEKRVKRARAAILSKAFTGSLVDQQP